MNRDFNKNLPYYLLLAFLIGFVIFVYQSEGTAGGADDLNHYRFARYAFQNPAFFFNTKAKTVYTLLCAPVAQLGYNALRVFNVLLGLGAALLTFLTARRLKFEQPVLALFLLVFAPVYTLMMLSGMTEIMFSFFLALGIYLHFRHYGIWSAVVLSLLPFIRTEGFVLFPFFMLAWILNRQWKALPFIFTGFLLVSLAGSFHYGDFFWVINQNPYTGDAVDIYGTGPLFHYVQRFNAIFGLPFFVLLAGGLLLTPVVFFRRHGEERREFLDQVLAGFMPFLVYFAAHSYVYWKGTGNSVGEIRVMAAVFPSAVLLALFAWDRFLQVLRPGMLIRAGLGIALAGLLVFIPFSVRKIPVELWPPEKLIKEAVNWLKEVDYTDRKIYFWDPHWWFFLDKNPTDRASMQEGFPYRDNPSRLTRPGELVLWDAHFGPNEGKTPLEMLTGNPDFAELKAFRPDPPFTVLGGYPYEIHIFERLENHNKLELQAILEEIQKREDSGVRITILEYQDCEPGEYEKDLSGYSGQHAGSGSYSCLIDENLEFMEGLVIPVGEISLTPKTRINIRFSDYFEEVNSDDPLLLVMSLQKNNELLYYRSWQIETSRLFAWNKHEFETGFPRSVSDSDTLKVYHWNRGGNRLLLDDFIISIREPVE